MYPIQIQEVKANSFGLQCYYCEILLDNTTEAKRNSRTKDHIIPTSKGGKNTKINKVYCCNSCNQLKKSLFLEDFFLKILDLYNKDYDFRYSIMLINIGKLIKYKNKNCKKMIKNDKNQRRYNSFYFS